MNERASRGRIDFDDLTHEEFEDLVCETLGQSEFIELEHVDNGIVIYEPLDEDAKAREMIEQELEAVDSPWSLVDVHIEDEHDRSEKIDLVKPDYSEYGELKVGAQTVEAIKSAGFEITAWFPNVFSEPENQDDPTMRVWVDVVEGVDDER